MTMYLGSQKVTVNHSKATLERRQNKNGVVNVQTESGLFITCMARSLTDFPVTQGGMPCWK